MTEINKLFEKALNKDLTLKDVENYETKQIKKDITERGFN